MSEEAARLVPFLLPVDPGALESMIDDLPEIDVIAAITASFTLAARQMLSKVDAAERLNFCRRVAGRCEDDVQAWMVEAALRSAEGDRDAIIGVHGDAMAEIQGAGLFLMADTYLTRAECEALHQDAIEQALTIRPLLVAATTIRG